MKAVSSEEHLFLLYNLKNWVDEHPNIKYEIQQRIKYDLDDYLDKEIVHHKKELDIDLAIFKQKLIVQRRERFINNFFKNNKKKYSEQQKQAIISILEKKDYLIEEVLKFANPDFEPWRIRIAAHYVKDGFNEIQWSKCFENEFDKDKVYYLCELIKTGIDENIFNHFLTKKHPEAIIGLYLLGLKNNVDKNQLQDDLLSKTYFKRDLFQTRRDLENHIMFKRKLPSYESEYNNLIYNLKLKYGDSLEYTLKLAESKRNQQQINTLKQKKCRQQR